MELGAVSECVLVDRYDVHRCQQFIPEVDCKHDHDSFHSSHTLVCDALSLPSEGRVRTSLVAQWMRICLPRQETRVQSLVQGKSHMPGSSYAHAAQLLGLCSGARKPQPPSPRAAAVDAYTPWSPRSAAAEATAARRLSTATRLSSPACHKQRKACAAVKAQHN